MITYTNDIKSVISNLQPSSFYGCGLQLEILEQLVKFFTDLADHKKSQLLHIAPLPDGGRESSTELPIMKTDNMSGETIADVGDVT